MQVSTLYGLVLDLPSWKSYWRKDLQEGKAQGKVKKSGIESISLYDGGPIAQKEYSDCHGTSEDFRRKTGCGWSRLWHSGWMARVCWKISAPVRIGESSTSEDTLTITVRYFWEETYPMGELKTYSLTQTLVLYGRPFMFVVQEQKYLARRNHSIYNASAALLFLWHWIKPSEVKRCRKINRSRRKAKRIRCTF